MKRHFLFAALSAFTFIPLSVHAATNTAAFATSLPTSPTAVVARVNGADITRTQLDEAIQEAMGAMAMRGQPLPAEHQKQVEQQVLDSMIAQELMLAKSKALKVDDLDAKVKEQWEKIKKQVPDEKAFAEKLKEAKLTEEKLKQKIAEGVQMEALIDKEVRSKIQIAPAEVKEFYDSNPKYFSQPAQIKASHILVKVPEGADDKVKAEKKAAIDAARERVVKGEDFAKVAGEVSEDTHSKVQGGDLGFFGQDQMVKPFGEVAFALKSNEVSQVVTTQYGYHIIKQTGSRPSATVPLEQEKAKIEKYLSQQKVQQGVKAYVESLKKDAKIEVLLK